MPLSVVLRVTPHFHGHLKAAFQPLSGVIKLTLPIETPVIHVPLSGRVGGTLPHKSYSSLSWVDQTANGRLRGQSPQSGFAVIGPFEPMPAGTGIAPPRCHPPQDGGTLRHVNNSLPGPLSEGSVHGNGSRQPDNWRSALAEPFVSVLAHGNGVYFGREGLWYRGQWRGRLAWPWRCRSEFGECLGAYVRKCVVFWWQVSVGIWSFSSSLAQRRWIRNHYGDDNRVCENISCLRPGFAIYFYLHL